MKFLSMFVALSLLATTACSTSENSDNNLSSLKNIAERVGKANEGKTYVGRTSSGTDCAVYVEATGGPSQYLFAIGNNSEKRVQEGWEDDEHYDASAMDLHRAQPFGSEDVLQGKTRLGPKADVEIRFSSAENDRLTSYKLQNTECNHLK